jgi:hypothetical protein
LDNNNNSITENSIRVTCTAFADDTTWLASNRAQIIKIISISNSFFALNDIKINSEKSKLLVWNKKDKGTPVQITMGIDNAIVKANHPTKETRYLGIYLRTRAGNSHTIKQIKNKITLICNTLRNKTVMTAQLIYVNNKVLLSRIEYWIKMINISETQCKLLHNCYIKMVKHKMKIISTANNNIITHQEIVGCTALHQHLRKAQFAEFIIRINSKDWDGISMRIMLRITQLHLGLTECILTTNLNNILSFNSKNNFNFSILQAMKDQLLDFDLIPDSDNTWNLNFNGLTIISFFKNDLSNVSIQIDLSLTGINKVMKNLY